MSDEYGWPDFHDPGGHDDPGHHDDPGAGHEEPLPEADPFHLQDDLFAHHDDLPRELPDDPGPGADDDPGWDDHAEPGTGYDDVAVHEVVDVTDGHGMGPIGADPDAVEVAGDPVGLFPPVVDVGPLPEPVDGFPWIDTGSLGLTDLHTAGAGAVPVDPQELAAYAAEDLPPGVDPWAALAGSEDPATGALARWWSEHG
ncbi:hypothetical protein [Pseudosporangium ferrugineum]|uniref:Uncharacterized protein n=1 Tax=Pseudosporangium ferrugineum TaxID=439699 RepID=A0A2T0SHK6_9ACTN|nr:hypothetical protein [Pseudosporangium ferrugineum]PRY32843.1 hypothetical protein CLV70_1012 [Pseudosporangium ferrugineum]